MVGWQPVTWAGTISSHVSVQRCLGTSVFSVDSLISYGLLSFSGFARNFKIEYWLVIACHGLLGVTV